MNIGDKIPEILGIDQDGREIKASDYRGRKIVLYSYPKANIRLRAVVTLLCALVLPYAIYSLLPIRGFLVYRYIL